MVSGEGRNNIDSEDDDDVVENPEDTVVLSDDDDDDDFGSTTEINVDELVAKIEKTDAAELAKKRAARKRLEELQDQLYGDDEFGSTYAFDLDEDLST